MYIWILLATIMAALSFFNLSPRRDKDNTYSEIKTATIVNRFRLENNAVTRLLQCETLMNMHSGNPQWDAGDAPYRINLTATDTAEDGTTVYVSNPALDFGYTTPADNLPVGYESDPNFTVYHYVYCLDRPAEESGAEIMRPCQYGSMVHPTYVVSFALVPTRYLVKNAAADGTIDPLPMFVKYLADETKGQGIAGWLTCTAAGSCEFKGSSSFQVTNIINDETNEAVTNKRSNLPLNSVFFDNADFRNVCLTTQPCMFLYRKMPTTDENAYCRHRMIGYQHYLENPPEEPEEP